MSATPPDGADTPLFELSGLSLSLPDLNAKRPFRPAPPIDILHGIDLAIPRGCCIGIVGESGSGKSTLGRCLVRLHEPTGGSLSLDGEDITHRGADAMLPLRRDLQVIFQDPYSSLNPRRTIAAIVAAPLVLHEPGRTRAEYRDMAVEALERVGLPGAFADRYPHELSGGQRQRVGIARAVALRPRFVFADEVVSGLDTSSQARIIALLNELRASLDLTIAFVSHDLSVVRHLCDRVAVMQAGRIVETGETAAVFENPRHEHTRALKAAIPLPDIEPGWLAPEAVEKAV